MRALAVLIAVARRAMMSLCRRGLLALVFLFILIAVPGESLSPEARFEMQVRMLAAPYRFNLWAWEVQGLAQKAREMFVNPAADLTSSQAVRLVHEYVATARQIGEFERRIERIYASAAEADPDAATAGLRAQVAMLRQVQAKRRPMVEAILQAQISAVLADEGLTVLGLVWPPVKFAFSEPPYYLIVSPRARIELRLGVYLQSDLPVDQHIALEEQVEALGDVSALVEGIGGFGSFPTMVIDRAGLDWILNTIAHEWTHNYLVFYPLGWNYYSSRDTVTLNETVASIVGDEVGQKALERFYPELVSLKRTQASQERPLEEKAFDFGREMRATRLAVDALLAKGYVREAEAFMEARRRRLVEHGYVIRRLNQAYFAFHGSYATGPSAVDPIGPKLTKLREASPSLAAFLRTAARITSVAELDAALQRLGAVP
ncbi:MAG: hypothetical protein RML36_10790 [Anaerolineae bacterium]|nr:hypothetical protein [Anaerolineae bacterium]MDW8099954.1 hypothetical protein [Anaerolineae bacterium]